MKNLKGNYTKKKYHIPCHMESMSTACLVTAHACSVCRLTLSSSLFTYIACLERKCTKINSKLQDLLTAPMLHVSFVVRKHDQLAETLAFCFQYHQIFAKIPEHLMAWKELAMVLLCGKLPKHCRHPTLANVNTLHSLRSGALPIARITKLTHFSLKFSS